MTSAEVVGAVRPETPFPITESAMEAADGGETEFLLDNRHLYLRTGRMTDMLKIRSSVLERFIPTSVAETSPNTKHLTLLPVLLKGALHYSKYHTLDVRHT